MEHQHCDTCINFGNCGCDDLREREYLRREGKDCYKSKDIDFIIQNYEIVLSERTLTMSKPTYHWQDVVSEIDRWYEED